MLCYKTVTTEILYPSQKADTVLADKQAVTSTWHNGKDTLNKCFLFLVFSLSNV